MRNRHDRIPREGAQVAATSSSHPLRWRGLRVVLAPPTLKDRNDREPLWGRLANRLLTAGRVLPPKGAQIQVLSGPERRTGFGLRTVGKVAGLVRTGLDATARGPIRRKDATSPRPDPSRPTDRGCVEVPHPVLRTAASAWSMIMGIQSRRRLNTDWTAPRVVAVGGDHRLLAHDDDQGVVLVVPSEVFHRPCEEASHLGGPPMIAIRAWPKPSPTTDP